MAATVVGLLTHLGRVDTAEPVRNVLAIDGGILINWPNYRVQFTVCLVKNKCTPPPSGGTLCDSNTSHGTNRCRMQAAMCNPEVGKDVQHVALPGKAVSVPTPTIARGLSEKSACANSINLCWLA